MAARDRRWSRAYPLILAISGCAGHGLDQSEPAPQGQFGSAGKSANGPLSTDANSADFDSTQCEERLPRDGLAIAPPKPSSTCSVSDRDASKICDGARCPVSRAYEFGCAGSGYGPWVVPSGPSGSVTMFVTNTGEFDTHLFSVDAESAVAEDVAEPTSALNSLASDHCGRVSLFSGQSPGIQLISSEAPAQWLRQEVVTLPLPALAMLADARTMNDSAGLAAYYQMDDHLPRIALREQSGWSTRVLGNTRVTSMGLDVDDRGAPWVAWLRDDQAGFPSLDLVAPDGSIHHVSSGSLIEPTDFWRKPVVLAGGITGTSAYPALAAALGDGVHLWTADATGSHWSDHLLFSPADSGDTRGAGDCVYDDSGTDPCGGKTTCTRVWNEARGRLGLVRTQSGRAYAAWVQSAGEVNYTLSRSVSTRTGKAICQPQAASSRGTAELVIAALTDELAVPPTITRLRFEVGSPLDDRGLALAVRGDSLLLAASLGAGEDAKITYLEVDSARLGPENSDSL